MKQIFWMSYAYTWCNTEDPDTVETLILTDVHAPAEYRADTVRNLDAWYGAFDVKPGQALYLAPTERARVY